MVAERGLGRLQGKVAMITGAARTRGMGYATARLFAREGAVVILADIDDQVLLRAEELRKDGRRAGAFVADLSKATQVDEMVRRAQDAHGTIDILCNVAGNSLPPRPPFLEMSEEYWDKVLAINVKTCFNCCKAVAPGMVAQKYGKIVNWSSVTGTHTVYRYSAAYAASKGAICALTMALALELGEHNVSVNSVVPGDIDSQSDKPWAPGQPRRDMGILATHLSPAVARPGSPEEVANLALFLCTDESRFIAGTEIVIDGGAIIVEPGAVVPNFKRAGS